MSNDIYYGKYLRFEHPDRKAGACLLGADNLIGDRFEIEFVVEKGNSIAQIKNRFGAYVGRFDSAASRELRLLTARSWKINVLLSFVAFSNTSNSGRYWGQMAVIAYDQHYSDCFDRYVNNVAARLMEGIRPKINLGEQAVREVISKKGDWTPKNTVSLPTCPSETIMMKTRRNLKDNMIEAARNRNIGCYIVSIAFLVACAAGVFYLLKFIGLW